MWPNLLHFFVNRVTLEMRVVFFDFHATGGILPILLRGVARRRNAEPACFGAFHQNVNAIAFFCLSHVTLPSLKIYAV